MKTQYCSLLLRCTAGKHAGAITATHSLVSRFNAGQSRRRAHSAAPTCTASGGRCCHGCCRPKSSLWAPPLCPRSTAIKKHTLGVMLECFNGTSSWQLLTPCTARAKHDSGWLFSEMTPRLGTHVMSLTCDRAWNTSSKLSQGMCSHSGHALSAACVLTDGWAWQTTPTARQHKCQT